MLIKISLKDTFHSSFKYFGRLLKLSTDLDKSLVSPVQLLKVFLKSKWGAFSLHILKHEGKAVHSTKIFLQSFHYGSTHIHWHNEDGEIG